MSYLDELASEIEDHLPEGLLPDENTAPLFHLYALLLLAKGRAVNACDVHNAWVSWMQERDPEHPSIKPFGELDAETRAADEPFVRAIRAVAERLERIPA